MASLARTPPGAGAGRARRDEPTSRTFVQRPPAGRGKARRLDDAWPCGNLPVKQPASRRAKTPPEGPRVRRAEPADRARPRRRRADRGDSAEQPKPIGEVLLAEGLIDRATLAWALARQQETGERVGQILLAAGRVHRLELQRALGAQWGLPFVDLLNSDVDQVLVRGFPAETLLQEGWVPVAVEGDRTVVATCEPPDEEARERICAHFPTGTKLSFRTTTPIDVERTVLLCFREHFVRRSTGELLARRPDLSAATGWSTGQKRVVAAGAILFAIGMVVQWQLTLAIIVAAANLVFLAAVGFKPWRASSASPPAHGPCPRGPSATTGCCRATRSWSRSTGRRM